ncbi:MAG: hypothetical protein Q9M10_05915 [Mariprofundaceae bacterium]|nr:hypothetical protein [Mariprofundaceae bacterium]
MSDMTYQRLIRDNLALLEDSKKMNALSTCFFTHLFHLSPELADVLNGDVAMLQRKFTSTIATLKNIRYLDKISSALEAMALRHVGYGAECHHFAAFRQALLSALQEILGESFTTEHQEAWGKTFDAVSDIMQKVMSQQPKPFKKKTIAMTQSTHLLDDIGGIEKVYAVHQRFYDAMYEDAYLFGFFQHRAKHELIEKQTEFMVAAFGGENHYVGQPPAFVHMHMFITKEMSDIRTIYLKKAIQDEGLNLDIQQRWLAIDHAFHASIEKKSVDECVMRAVFQQPLVVHKPEHYQAPKDECS